MIDVPQVQFCTLPNGQQLSWREWGAGEPFILLHGWSMSSAVFSEVAPVLAKKYRVLCPDLPGHGQSDSVADCQLGVLAMAIEQWAQQLGVANPSLLGWSLGGQVALQIAANKLLSVKKLLLISTTPRFCQSDDWQYGLPATQIKSLTRNLERAYAKTMGDFFNLQFVGEDLAKERYRQILAFAVRREQLPKPEQAQKTLAVLGSADLRNLLLDVQQPVLVMHGGLDQIIPFAAGEFLVHQLPKARLYRLPSAGHAPFFSCPEETVDQWLKFLQ